MKNLYLTAEEVGTILGCQRRRVCTLARAGRIEGEAVSKTRPGRGIQWRFTKEAVDAFMNGPEYGLRLVTTEAITATRDQIIWFAGFFDGEGCIHLQPDRGRRNWRLGLILGGTFRKLVYELPLLFGGKARDLGYLRPDQQPQARWVANGRQAGIVLKAIEPYLRVKLPHARLAIEFQDRVDRGSYNGHRPIPEEELAWRADIAAQVKYLNHHYE